MHPRGAGRCVGWERVGQLKGPSIALCYNLLRFSLSFISFAVSILSQSKGKTYSPYQELFSGPYTKQVCEPSLGSILGIITMQRIINVFSKRSNKSDMSTSDEPTTSINEQPLSSVGGEESSSSSGMLTNISSHALSELTIPSNAHFLLLLHNSCLILTSRSSRDRRTRGYKGRRSE